MVLTIIRLGLMRAMRNKFALLCQVLALFATMAPLMLIFGLKYGVVSSLKDNLLKNPTTLEIRPTDGVQITENELLQIKKFQETAFALPTTSAAYSSICLNKGAPTQHTYPTYTLVSTAKGDPILARSNISVPSPGEIVVTAPLAKEEKLRVGDKVVLTAWRNSNKERFDSEVIVKGIIEESYSKNQKQIFAPAEYTYDAELFLITGKGKERAAPKLSSTCYSGMITNCRDAEKMKPLAAALPPFWQFGTAGEANMKHVDGTVQVLYSARHKLTANDANALIMSAAALGVQAYPWVEPYCIKLPESAGGHEVEIIPLDHMVGHADTCPSTPTLYVNLKQKKENDAMLVFKTSQAESRIRVLLKEHESVPEGIAYAAPQLAALLQMANQQAIVWDYAEGVCYRPLGSFCHMRLYAKDLESVEPLVQKVRNLGVPCVAATFAIKRVFALERSLHNLFLIVCTSAGLGAAVSYAMSLFNAAELHRRDYAIIQLLGGGRFVLTLMPLIDALVTVLASFVFSLGTFYIISSLISYMFAETAGNTFVCRLEVEHVAVFAIAGVCIAILAAFVAAVKVLSVSPSEIIRES